MNEITGNFEEAVRLTSDVLKVKGTVLPVTLDNICLLAELENRICKRGIQNSQGCIGKGQRIKRYQFTPPMRPP